MPTSGRLDDGVVATFRDAMDDDFATPEAMAVVFATARAANSAIDAGDVERAARGVATVRELCRAVGLELDDGAGEGDEEIDALVRQRTERRAAGDYAGADRIRDELTARGVTLEDTPNGTIWHRQ